MQKQCPETYIRDTLVSQETASSCLRAQTSSFRGWNLERVSREASPPGKITRGERAQRGGIVYPQIGSPQIKEK